MCLETGGSRGACQPAILAKRDPEEQPGGWSQVSAGTCRHVNTQELAHGFSRSGPSFLARRPLMPGLGTTLLFLCMDLAQRSCPSHRPVVPSFLSCGFAFLSSVLRLPHTPHPASLLFSYLFSVLYFALTQPLIPDWFKRPHPGSPAEQGCSVHVLYPVAGCHLKVIADTSQTLLSEATARDSISK